MTNIPLQQQPLIYAAIRIAKRKPNYQPTREHITKVVPYPELAFLANIPNKDISRYSKEEPNVDINDFYTNLNQKNGVVITPPHLANLLLTLTQATPDSTIYDPCVGTGRLLEQHTGPKISTELIHENAIIAEAVLNTDITVGSCFSSNLSTPADNSVLNPPYSIKPKELEFIIHAANNTKKGNLLTAVVPKSVGTDRSNNALKAKLMKDHTLEAVISLPGDIFNGVGTHTVIMIIKSGIPHHVSKSKTMFVNFEDDGFKLKKKGVRVDNNFEERKEWLMNTLNNRESESGFSAFVSVGYEDEWGVENYAYFVDYSELTSENFISDLKERAIYEYRSA